MLVAEQAIGADLDQKYVLVLNDKNQPEKTHGQARARYSTACG